MEIFPLAFAKMSGAGNDFIIVDHRHRQLALAEQPDFARKVCRRKFSVGADGLILIEDSKTADFQWQFYNADGSVAEMCGNGARCAARFAYERGIAGKSMRFQTIAGVIEAEVMDDGANVSLRMTDPVGCQLDRAIEVGGRQLQISAIDTGVPHAVIFIDEGDIPVKQWGREIRFHPQFQPAGTNVNFVRLLPDASLHVRTYERGVEDETLACGTGAVASAIIAGLSRKARSPVQVVTSGGERLTVIFDILGDSSIVDVCLQGPARLIYEGQLVAEALL
ncbi:MAG: diaminopimelate epimerase [Desulfobulbaceae bacterium]|nr:MAG: diaminopimelate epimerase [Desulfobulbaceae bacterium]